MRFLVDECTGPRVAEWLRAQGHEVFSIFTEARGADDDSILGKANSGGWILITNDRDFGEKVFRERRPHRGVIFMRLEDERAANQIRVIRSLLENFGGRLADQFVVVTETRVRFARPQS